MRKRVRILVCTCAGVALLGGLLFAPTVYSFKPGGLAPSAFIRDYVGAPQEWIAALVEREGGLPKSDFALTCHMVAQYGCDIGFTESLDVHPVEDWEIERITVKGGRLLPSALAGEMAYTIEVDFRVHYTDGDNVLFRWDTWRYGWCLGPMAIDTGGGPAGDISPILSNPG